MIFLLILLSFNILSVGIFLFEHGANPFLYLNLFGCVIFGYALKDFIK